MVVEPDYTWAFGFVDGLAAVEKWGSSWGFIDKTGAVVIEPLYAEVSTFVDGLAAARTVVQTDPAKTLWGFVDKTGQWVIEPQFDDAQGFVDGLAPVYTGGVEDPILRGGKWGYIDTSGTYVRAAIRPRGRVPQRLGLGGDGRPRMGVHRYHGQGRVVGPLPPGWD